jgi:hypothetical protein
MPYAATGAHPSTNLSIPLKLQILILKTVKKSRNSYILCDFFLALGNVDYVIWLKFG